MRVKNISSTKIELEELNLFLNPGDMQDLSEFDPKMLHQNKRLNSYMAKGLLINLGNSSPAGSLAAMRSARNRISNLGLTDYIAKPAKKGAVNNRSKIDALLKKTPRNPPKAGFDSTKERYSDEYHANMNPTTPREDYSKPKPRPKIDDSFRSMQVNPDGVVSEFGSYGIIETGVLTGEQNLLAPELKASQPKTEDIIEVKDLDGNNYSVSIDSIKERVKRKCIGFTNTGKACKKWAVLGGFSSCMTHMSQSEKIEYEKIKQNTKT